MTAMTADALNRRGFMAMAGAAAAGLVPAAMATAAQATPAEQANVRLVNEFCAAWASRDFDRILAYVGDDNVYRMTETTPPAIGHAGIRERLGQWLKDSDSIDFKVLDTWAKGPMVINHRIDTFASRVRPLTWEGVGVFFVKDGKIREWHDYTIRVTR
jgi:limonene-1,2-epoxide hydrolase